MSKHTPGPWSFSIKPQPNGCPIVGARGLMVCMLAHSVNHADQVDEAMSNARLIAAAPTMREFIAKRAAAGDSEAAALLESIDASR